MQCPKCKSHNVRNEIGSEYKCRSCGVKFKVQSVETGGSTVAAEVLDTVSTVMLVDAVTDVASEAIGGLADAIGGMFD